MTLKYYRNEAIRCWRFNGKAFNAAQTFELVLKLTRLIGLPDIHAQFDLRRDAKFSGYYTYNFFYNTHKIHFKAIDTDLLTIMHEVAHYWDYYNRMREIQQRFGVTYANRSKTTPENRELIEVIRNKHAHGKAHKQYMDLMCVIVQKNFPEYVIQGPEQQEISTCKKNFKECQPTKKSELLNFMSTFIGANSSLIAEVAQHA